MQTRSIRAGRPTGTTTYEADTAKAFGMAVRALRTQQALAQEALANMAGIDRSHMGKIERGKHMPTLAIILRIAEALGCDASTLVAETEHNLTRLREVGAT
ncbi:helix-turn-helix domain-containing protein [Pseudomonas citronellolis]|uniref:helix-turn-helix domain-containing protein n=1 Tax=Pseudomonas citronellolis TaxID=53408 RepID=UPI0021C24AF5|nr:helix-turn-helix transcriptional regulator [Pseudomonas citronellolis]UXJ55803.1 helix-turn-helix domain-containing protein [Pseudomonas citronellolis]